MRSSNKRFPISLLRRAVAVALISALLLPAFSSLAVSASSSKGDRKDYSDYTFEDFYRELMEKEKAKEEEEKKKAEEESDKADDGSSDDAEDDTEDSETEGSEDTEGDETEAEDKDPADSKDKDSETDDKDGTADNEEDKDEEDKPTPSAPSVDGAAAEADGKLIRVGLMYGTNVTVGFEVTTDNGFVINRVKREGDLSNKPLWELDIQKISVTVDANLKKTDMTYSKTSTPSSVVIGGYHIEITKGVSADEAAELIEELEPTLDEMGIYAIPSYVYNGIRIRAGHYADKETAEVAAEELAEAFPELVIGVASPTLTAVSVVDPLTDTVLFEYDEGDVTALGLTPIDNGDGSRAYLVTPAKKPYDGTFMFRRYINGSTDGVSLTDIIPLGEYIKGVLPYEISNSWPIEAQKAFAICVRSYTLSAINRHQSAYQVDVCNTTHCQVYNGRTLINSLVNQAVEETAGLVMSYNGKIVTAFYSAATGGVTVNVEDAWGGAAQPYLVAVETPWEIFTNHTNGVWTAEVSGEELGAYLRDTKGYKSIKGSIVDIRIDKLAKNSTYVYQITFTDSYGNELTVKTTDGVRTALSKYVKSANFVVGKGSVESNTYTFTSGSYDKLFTLVADAVNEIKKGDSFSVLTADGEADTSTEGTLVITASGVRPLDGTYMVFEPTTVKAQNKNNFIFSGLGWGHGVGLSQIGVRDLAKLGYEATDILGKYFTNIEIRDWRDVLGEK